MAIAQAEPRSALGTVAPRVAPPVPASSLLEDFTATATEIGVTLLPWQTVAARYLTARGLHGWLYPEVCIAVARQNGKTELLLPRILMDLRAGRHVIHTAQNRTLPRQVYLRTARALDPKDVVSIRYANGQEKIEMANGGSYTIIAPQRGARGLSADTLILDEVREFEDFDIIAAASPTLTASSDPQTIYLSNAGSDASAVLNDLKRRGEEGGGDELAYLEWSASIERTPDDRDGWAEANPSLGHFPHMLRYLEKQYASLPLPEFETEHLCRWVASMQPKLVSSIAWNLCEGAVDDPIRPSLGINMDPTGKRASAVMAWEQADGRIACVELAEATGDPIDVDVLAKDWKLEAMKHRVRDISFSSWTDADFAQNFLNAKPIDAKEFAQASEKFARLVQQGRLLWSGATHISEDLLWTSRKPHESGAWMAVPATSERSITAVLAAIRAVWRASAPRGDVPRVF